MSACSHQGTDPTMSTRSPPRRPHLCLVTSQRSYLLSHQELSFQYIKFEEKKTYRPYEWSYEAKYSKAIALGAGKIKMMIMMVVSLKIFFKRFIHLCVCARAHVSMRLQRSDSNCQESVLCLYYLCVRAIDTACPRTTCVSQFSPSTMLVSRTQCKLVGLKPRTPTLF
jgi:hypothetical protein